MTRVIRKAGVVLKRAIELSKYFVADAVGVLRDTGYAIRVTARRLLL
jgi:hypothetical protein